jgi:hypothetical protein
LDEEVAEAELEFIGQVVQGEEALDEGLDLESVELWVSR